MINFKEWRIFLIITLVNAIRQKIVIVGARSFKAHHLIMYRHNVKIITCHLAFFILTDVDTTTYSRCSA